MTSHRFHDRISTWPGERPSVTESVLRVLHDGTWGSYRGASCKALEQALAERFRQSHVTLCSSGTIGIEMALRAVGVSEGDEVIVAGYDYPGNFRCVEAVAATPVWIDISNQSWTISLEAIETAKSNKTKAAVVSHLHGKLAQVDAIRRWCDANNVALIEDTCQVPGASIAGQPVGAFGHVSVVSFGGSKLLSAGRGGAVMTSIDSMHQRLKIWQDRGNDLAPLSELQAAALLPQLNDFDEITCRRADAARELIVQLAPIADLLLPIDFANNSDRQAYYKLPFWISDGLIAMTSREELIAEFQNEDLPIDAGFQVFKNRFRRNARVVGELKNSILAGKRTLLLHHPALLCDASTIHDIAQTMIDCVRRKIAT